ncbi:similar to Saccharomyces cerevisiae YDL089W NUR1 Protein of unknown function [Maudiozyma saulgeensis]|uniref:Nuclear rim protein 1 n=1 Tax=Maudiozyma saulgeensis TaxID=1789683 RepID=A0A1X7R0M4_9SACH|nr:similar to Saccharomyces cerevisiae YDL089W NUR1 Protein of unknown function [Kazachstania saulgeensis]
MSMRISKTQRVSPLDTHDEMNESEINAPKGYLRKILYYMTMSPSDIQLVVYEQIESINWDAKAVEIAKPLGMSATLLFYALRLLQDNIVKPNYYKEHRNQNAFDLSKSQTLREMPYLDRYLTSKISVERKQYAWFSTIDTFINCALFVLILIDIKISYTYLYQQFKTYSIFNSEPSKSSPNLTKCSLDDLSKSYYKYISRKNIWSMLKYFIFEKTNGEMLDHELSDKYFYTLNKWNPTKFMTQLFVFFNPTIIGFLWISDVSFITFLVVLLNWSILSFVILQRYEVKLVDESIISSATIDDIQKKVIQPNVNKRFQNVMVDATDYRQPFVKFEPSILHNPIFETHSLNGDLVKEKYNRLTFEFEDIPDETNAHNIITN